MKKHPKDMDQFELEQHIAENDMLGISFCMIVGILFVLGSIIFIVSMVMI